MTPWDTPKSISTLLREAGFEHERTEAGPHRVTRNGVLVAYLSARGAVELLQSAGLLAPEVRQ